MRKTFLFLSVALMLIGASSVAANAQTQTEPSKKEQNVDFAKRRADRLKTELDLNESQYKKVYDYFNTQKESNQERVQKTHDFMKDVLTPSQYTKFESLKGKGGKGGKDCNECKNCKNKKDGHKGKRPEPRELQKNN